MPIQTPANYEDEDDVRYTPAWWQETLNVSSLGNTFESFKLVTGTGPALAAFKDIASGKSSWNQLLCYGGTGNGKTHLLEALAIAMAKQGRIARIQTMADLMRRLKASMNRDKSSTGYSYDEVLSFQLNAKVMLMDEVGMGSTPWDFEKLEEITVYRHSKNLMTVFTTNLDIKPNPSNSDEPYIPERIVSRFSDREKARIVLNKAADYRPRKEGDNETL